ncbi:hypothetical protein [Aliarcobacter cryaerophilus]|uniref:hypothetical protein n=1 Tax=Aliarcobacter cryaerophilus TaxID=28198 RepID=UPI003DA57CA8
MANEGNIKIYDKELKKDLEMPFKDLLMEGTEIPKNSIYMTEKYLSDKGFDFNFAKDDYGIGGVELSCKNRSKPDNDARVRPDAKTEFNRTVKRCSTGH